MMDSRNRMVARKPTASTGMVMSTGNRPRSAAATRPGTATRGPPQMSESMREPVDILSGPHAVPSQERPSTGSSLWSGPAWAPPDDTDDARPSTARILSMQAPTSIKLDKMPQRTRSDASSISSSPVTDFNNNTSTNNSSGTSRSIRRAESEMEEVGIVPLYDPATDMETLSLKPAGQTVPVSLGNDIRDFLIRPSQHQGTVQCYIERTKTSQGPKYTLKMQSNDRFLLSARKRNKKKSSNYLVSLDPDDLKRESGSYFGKLRANFVGTEFIGYDKGANPDDFDAATLAASKGGVRQELCVVIYAYNVLGTRGPRKMSVVIPDIDEEGQRILYRPLKPEDSMLERFKRNDFAGTTILRNKSPSWNDKIGAYCLNFSGRVTKPSVKNFQLVTNENQQYIVMQFGKTGKDTFTMDYQFPLCPLQAFLIALSSFDNKIACE